VLIVNLIWDKIRHRTSFAIESAYVVCNGQRPRGESQIKCGDTKPFDLSNHWLAGFSSSRWKFSSKILNKICVKNASPKCITEVRVVIQLDQKSLFIAVYKIIWVGISVIVLNRTPIIIVVLVLHCVQWIHYLDKFQVTGSSLTLYCGVNVIYWCRKKSI
jgi:hypothetical protein